MLKVVLVGELCPAQLLATTLMLYTWLWSTKSWIVVLDVVKIDPDSIGGKTEK